MLRDNPAGALDADVHFQVVKAFIDRLRKAWTRQREEPIPAQQV